MPPIILQDTDLKETIERQPKSTLLYTLRLLKSIIYKGRADQTPLFLGDYTLDLFMVMFEYREDQTNLRSMLRTGKVSVMILLAKALGHQSDVEKWLT